MAFIKTKKGLNEYIKKVELQMEILPLSFIFTEEDKIAIDIIYRDLIEICNHRILSLSEEEK